ASRPTKICTPDGLSAYSRRHVAIVRGTKAGLPSENTRLKRSSRPSSSPGSYGRTLNWVIAGGFVGRGRGWAGAGRAPRRRGPRGGRRGREAPDGGRRARGRGGGGRRAPPPRLPPPPSPPPPPPPRPPPPGGPPPPAAGAAARRARARRSSPAPAARRASRR